VSALPILQSLLRRTGTRRFGLLDLFLILLGAGIAYWLIPGFTEGPGYWTEWCPGSPWVAAVVGVSAAPIRAASPCGHRSFWKTVVTRKSCSFLNTTLR